MNIESVQSNSNNNFDMYCRKMTRHKKEKLKKHKNKDIMINKPKKIKA